MNRRTFLKIAGAIGLPIPQAIAALGDEDSVPSQITHAGASGKHYIIGAVASSRQDGGALGVYSKDELVLVVPLAAPGMAYHMELALIGMPPVDPDRLRVHPIHGERCDAIVQLTLIKAVGEPMSLRAALSAKTRTVLLATT